MFIPFLLQSIHIKNSLEKSGYFQERNALADPVGDKAWAYSEPERRVELLYWIKHNRVRQVPDPSKNRSKTKYITVYILFVVYITIFSRICT